MCETRKLQKWSAADKLRIELAGMEPGVEVSELYRREGIMPTQYYSWNSPLMCSAEALFGVRRKSKAEQREEERHREALRHKDAVIAEITAENLGAKKKAH
jgi:transposase-like protein